MTSGGEPYLIYLAAKSGQTEQLEALLQDRMPQARSLENIHKSQQDLHEGLPLSVADYLEYVDKTTGLTPLLAAVLYHREQCARLLLEHGANVHNCGAKMDQTPLRMAVTDLNMDAKMIELLVSYGASPFLEAKDGLPSMLWTKCVAEGLTPMDQIVQLRQNRIGPMPNALGAVLLCLRRRCPFRGHLELKVDRYLGLSQTWRKFFCVLSPREKVPGYPLDMHLLIFSKNGFDPVTSIWVTDAAPIEIPLKAAHGRACYELALSARQQTKPPKLRAPGSTGSGYSIFVRALSKDAVEGRWLRKFVNLATADPGLAMVNGDSETQVPFRHPVDKAAAPATADKSSELQPFLQEGNGKRHSASFSFSSDSAHIPLRRTQDMTDARTEAHSRPAAGPTQRIPTISPITLPSVGPTQAPAPPTRQHSYTALPQQTPSADQPAYPTASQSASQGTQQAANRAACAPASQSSSFSSSVTAGQQPSSAVQSEVSSSASPARVNSMEVWRSNPAYGVVTNATNMGSKYRSSQSLPSAKGFASVDRRLTDSWRARLLEDLEDDSDNEQGADVRMTLPVVSEHDSLPALLEQWGMQNTEQAQNGSICQQGPVPRQQRSALHTAAPAEGHVSSVGPLPSHAQRLDAAFAQLPPAITSSHALAINFTTRADNLSQSSPLQNQDMNQQQRWQAEQNLQPGTAHASAPPQEASQFQTAADHNALEEAAAAQQVHDSPSAAVQASLLIESNVEMVKARSNMLDIPSAELLDSILDFANAVCGEQPNEGMEHPSQEGQAGGPVWNNGPSRAQSEPAKRRRAAFTSMSRASLASSIEPFSDDDDITILDTTEVKKLSPQGLQPLPEGQHPTDMLSSGAPANSMKPTHVNGPCEDDLVYEVQQAPNHAPFHHYSLSPQIVEQTSPSAAARYGHLNRMYDTSTSDISSHAAALNAQARNYQSSMAILNLSAHSHSDYSSLHQNSIYDSSGSQSRLEPDQQLYHDMNEQSAALPQMEPSEFREMIDDIMAHSEQQAAQVHLSGGAASTTNTLHPIWEDEEACLEGNDSPCPATIGMPAA